MDPNRVGTYQLHVGIPPAGVKHLWQIPNITSGNRVGMVQMSVGMHYFYVETPLLGFIIPAELYTTAILAVELCCDVVIGLNCSKSPKTCRNCSS